MTVFNEQSCIHPIIHVVRNHLCKTFRQHRCEEHKSDLIHIQRRKTIQGQTTEKVQG